MALGDTFATYQSLNARNIVFFEHQKINTATHDLA